MDNTIYLENVNTDIPREKINENEKWIKHVRCEGARFHVLSYALVYSPSLGNKVKISCSEPDCIYNKKEQNMEKEKEQKEETVAYANMGFYEDAFVIHWGINNIGFGDFLFETDKDGNVIIDNEAMDKDTIKKVMNFIIDNAKFKGE